MISKIINFLTTDIWNIRLDDVSRNKSFLIKYIRVIVLASKGFKEKRCNEKASALTFYTLLSIVPMLAMVFGVAKGFGIDSLLERELMSKLQGQEEALSKIIVFSRTMIKATKGGLIAGIGVAILFGTVIKLLGNIEDSFNDIWGVKVRRGIGRRFSDYLSIMLIAPLLFIMASSLTVVITTHVSEIVENIYLLKMAGPLIAIALTLLPYCIIWGLFSFVYVFMPNTKVNLSAGVLAGIIAGTIYQIIQLLYIEFQIGVAKYNAIYGGFAALPLFLIWLQISWTVVLVGAEISFAHQNVKTYEFEPVCLEVSHYYKRLLALRIVALLVKEFQNYGEPLTVEKALNLLNIPVRLLNMLLHELVACGIVSKVNLTDEKAVGYQPGKPPEALTIKGVIDALDRRGTDNIHITASKELEDLSRRLAAFGALIEQSPENIYLKDL